MGKKKDSPTADDVESNYRKRIETLLSKYEPRNRFTAHLPFKRDFGDLVEWADKTWTAKTQAEDDVARFSQGLDKANTEIGRLENILDATKKQLRERTDERDRQARELHGIHAEYAHRMQMTNSAHENKLSEMHDDFSRQINVLSDDVMIAQADSRAWTDEKLKKKFADMKLLVDKVTSPHATGQFYASSSVLSKIDSTGFLGRQPEASRFLLKKALWDLFFEHYFSSPFGFGSLGPGPGRTALVRLYASWRGVFGDGDNNGSRISEVFSQGQEPNKWRSITFESIMASVISSDSPDSHAYLLDMYESNIAACADKVENLLSQVSERPLNDKSRESIAKLSRLAAELGLQFGVQPSHMQLIRPPYGETVEIGKSFVDCVDSVMHRGAKIQVDIYVHPGLTRVGDGKKDFYGSVLLVPCSVYPTSR